MNKIKYDFNHISDVGNTSNSKDIKDNKHSNLYPDFERDAKTPKSSRISSNSYQYKLRLNSKSVDPNPQLKGPSSPHSSKHKQAEKPSFTNNFMKNLNANTNSNYPKKMSDLKANGNNGNTPTYSFMERNNPSFNTGTLKTTSDSEKIYNKLEESYNKIMGMKNKPNTPRESLYKMSKFTTNSTNTKTAEIGGNSNSLNVKNLKTMYTGSIKRDTSTGKINSTQLDKKTVRGTTNSNTTHSSNNSNRPGFSMDFNGMREKTNSRGIESRSVDHKDLKFNAKAFHQNTSLQNQNHGNDHNISLRKSEILSSNTLNSNLINTNINPSSSSNQQTPHKDLKDESNKELIKGYAANTDEGIVRNYNEDRVTIILNIVKPNSRDSNEVWPRCSFFGVYDGHGGSLCADYLRDNLHQFIIREGPFPWNPKDACMRGFTQCETSFLEMAQNIKQYNLENISLSQNNIERSGSCAVVVLIVGDMVYVSNVGDSRAILSSECGAKVYPLTKDHKPIEASESKRILENGGKIYRAQTTVNGKFAKENTILGPYRVLPGRLSVSRTFGDSEAKLVKYGGNPKVVVAEPEIKKFKITNDFDFIILASDGIFDKLNNKEVVQLVWETISRMKGNPSVQKQCMECVDVLIRTALMRKSLDNVTVVMVAFKDPLKSLRKEE